MAISNSIDSSSNPLRSNLTASQSSKGKGRSSASNAQPEAKVTKLADTLESSRPSGADQAAQAAKAARSEIAGGAEAKAKTAEAISAMAKNPDAALASQTNVSARKAMNLLG